LNPTAILKELKSHYPDAHCALEFKSPFELLIATILSAQCTDVRVNMVTPVLFKKYKNPKLMSEAKIENIEEIIRSTGFFKNKAKSIKGCSEVLTKKYNGNVPKTLEELIELPGVGRKTANVVLGNAFGISSGVVVDTHVTRLSNRFAWVTGQDAVKIETRLNKLFHQKEWIMLSHYLISHGREICKARNPDCAACFLSKGCPRKGL
jgi:endonuclease III